MQRGPFPLPGFPTIRYLPFCAKPDNLKSRHGINHHIRQEFSGVEVHIFLTP